MRDDRKRPRGVKRLFRLPFSRAGLRRDVDDELDFHLDSRAERLVDEGWEPEAARREARRRFGDPGPVRATCLAIDRSHQRRVRLSERLTDLLNDLRIAVRGLLRTPAVTLLAVLTLALGIGATTAIYSVLHAVLLRPLPFPEPQRVVFVWEGRHGTPGDASAGNFDEWRRHADAFAALGAWRGANFSLSATAQGSVPEMVRGARVTAGFFDVFAAGMERGRPFTRAEDRPGTAPVVVLGHDLWQRRWAGDPEVVGSVVRLDGREHAVVGVLPPAFDDAGLGADLYVPMAFTPRQLAEHDEHNLLVLGRLAPGVSREEAQRELRAITARLQEESFDEQRDVAPLVHSFAGDLVRDQRQRLLVLFAAAALVLLIACVNVSNLLLARGASRGREMAVRTALGARRGRLVRQLLTESFALAAAGAGAGLALAVLGVDALLALAPAGVPRLEQASVDGAAVACAVALAFLATLLAGTVPALRASRSRPREALQGGGRAGVSVRRDRARGALVAAEVALALVLMAAAGLLVRSGVEMARVEPGFEIDGRLTARFTLPEARYATAARVDGALREMVAAAEAVPGVASAAVSNQVPLGGGSTSNGMVPEGGVFDPNDLILGDLRIVSPGYLETLGVPLLRGRALTAADRAGAPVVMLVNQSLARRLFPDGDAVGRRVGCCVEPDSPDLWKTVVGVVGDVRGDGLGAEAPPQFYLPLGQEPEAAWRWLQGTMVLVVQAADGVDPGTLAAPLRRAVAEVDPELPLYDVATLEERLAASGAGARFNTVLFTLLAAAGLLLSAVGIYGTVAHLVEQRRHEIGVRLAVGATARRVVALVVRGALPALALGVAAGAAAAVAAGRLLESFLFRVGAADPLTLATVVAALLAVALTACLLPARRAARVDPMRTLAAD